MLDSIVRLFAPFHCLGCNTEQDRLLCPACVENVVRVPSRCYLCKAATRQYEVCASCRTRTSLRRVAVWTRHNGLPKELIHVAKYERAKAGLQEIAEMLTGLLPLFGEDVILTHLPTASSRIRERGYDQAMVIARHLARMNNSSYRPLLARLGQAHQVGSSRRERIIHTKNAFRPLHPDEIRGAHIVLIDDVCTTGASIEAAARVLKQAGAKRVDALVFAQPD